MKPEDFAGNEPGLFLEDYFLGKTRAYGLFQDRFRTLRRQFVVDILGTLRDGELTLEEDFFYHDGETDRRVWRIRRTDEHHYEGRADDVLGVAHGTAYGNALNWRYRMLLKVGSRLLPVRFDDWFFLQPDGVLINIADVSKFGMRIGNATIVFRSRPDTLLKSDATAEINAVPPIAVATSA